MSPMRLYLVLCVLGTALPLALFLPFVVSHGLDPAAFVRQLFANPVASFFGMDVIVSAVVLWCFVWIEGTRLRMRGLWLPVAGSLVVGVSLGLPLFLWMRERHMSGTATGTQP